MKSPVSCILSLACPIGGNEKLGKQLDGTIGAGLPDAGSSTESACGRYKLLFMSPDQCFLLTDATEPSGVLAMMEEALAGSAYLTNQSDNWVTLRLDGPLAVPALERICPIDLHTAGLGDGAVARTMMEHMGAIIHREGTDRFLLLSASSSARSFLHAVEASLEHVEPAGWLNRVTCRARPAHQPAHEPGCRLPRPASSPRRLQVQ